MARNARSGGINAGIGEDRYDELVMPIAGTGRVVMEEIAERFGRIDPDKRK